MARHHHQTAAALAALAALLMAAIMWLPSSRVPAASVAGPVTATYTLPLVA